MSPSEFIKSLGGSMDTVPSEFGAWVYTVSPTWGSEPPAGLSAEFRAACCYASNLAPFVAIGVHVTAHVEWDSIAAFALTAPTLADEHVHRSYFTNYKDDPAAAMAEIGAYFTGAYHAQKGLGE